MGAEGETDDEVVLTMRARQQRNFLATLLLSQGVPMVLHGDELGRTQHGNNNVYAQDSEIAWVHWDQTDHALVEFTAALTRLRREHPTFRRSKFFDGRPVRRGEGEPLPDLVWLRPDGTAMQPEDWEAGFGRTIGVFLNGQGIRGVTSRGERIVDKHFLVYFNAHTEPVDILIPMEDRSPDWDLIVDTNGGEPDGPPLKPGDTFSLGAHALAVLREHVDPAPDDRSVSATLSPAAG
jgi:glycogen operon protein